RPPFKADSPMKTLLQVVHEEPIPPRRLQSNVPLDLETVCLKCLEKNPGRRYASALALAEDLRRFLGGEPVRARPVGPLGQPARWARRRPAVAGLLALVALLTVVGFALVTWQWREAVSQREKAVSQREKTERLSAYTLLDQGLALCAGGDVDRGLLVLASCV